MKELPSRLLVVSSRELAQRSLEHVVGEALDGGARWVWFRDRNMPRAERRALGRRLLRLCEDAGAVLSVGGDAEEVRAIGSCAAHLPSGADPGRARAILGADALIGVSAHSLREAQSACLLGADYVTLSPIFESPGKPGYGPPLGPGALAGARRLSIPVVALGGIDQRRVDPCLAAGAQGVAIMGAIMTAPCVRSAVEELLAMPGFAGQRAAGAARTG